MNQITLRKPGRPPVASRWTECGRIAAIVAAEFGIEVREMLSARQAARVTMPRHVAIYLAYRTSNLSLPAIGRQFGRDHTSVMHACNRVASMINEDQQFRIRVARCEDAVRAPAAVLAEKAVQGSLDACEAEIEALASRAFALDPVGAAAAIVTALRIFLKEKESGHAQAS
jgi:hypothetical protein